MKNQMKLLIITFFLFLYFNSWSNAGQIEWPEYPENPFKIKLDSSQYQISGRGGIIVSDLNGDGLLDYIVSTKENDYGEGKASIGAYDHNGDIIWVKDQIDININGWAEYYGLPGWCGPGISAANVDEEGKTEIIHVNTKDEIIIREGSNGKIKKKIKVNLPKEGYFSRIKNSLNMFIYGSIKKAAKQLLFKPKRWSHFQIVNLEGDEDREIILQADPLPFRWLKALSLKTGKTLWENYGYVGVQHGGFRAADIDGDGFDEVVGAVMIDNDGSIVNKWNYRAFPGHFDCLIIADILSKEPGLEWVLLEEVHRDDKTTLLGKDKVFFYHSFNGQEPQSAAVGEFDLERHGLEIWCRSRFDNQKPWTIDSSGNTISSYKLNDKKPNGWSEKGVEIIFTIDWDGGPRNDIAAKERNGNGKICIMDPITGEFIKWWEENAARIYVVDVAGDYREEIVVINSRENEIRIYWNNEENKHGRVERYWDRNHYRRQKLNYNYYSR